MRHIKLALLVLALFCAGAGSVSAAPSYTVKNWFTIHAPWEDLGPVAIYDFNGDEWVVGLESKVVSFPKVKNLSLTAGAVTDASNSNEGELREKSRDFLESGTPFVGVRYDIVNILPGLFDDRLHVGAAYGWNFAEGKSLWGFKTTYSLVKF